MGTVENRQKVAAGIPPSAGVLVEGWPWVSVAVPTEPLTSSTEKAELSPSLLPN